ncbi:MAG TPA: c-type cytochrome [Stenomitos sp.]
MGRHRAFSLAVLALVLTGCSHRPAFGPPSEESLPNDAYGQTVRYGKQLVQQTGVYAKPYVGSALSCTNCHLDAGRRPFAAPFVGVMATYPQYRARSARVDTLEDRINDCFQRSLNGKPLPENSREMRALVTYMAWLSTGLPIGKKVEGMGFRRLAPKSPHPASGKPIYAQSCATCHGSEGQGQGTFPPLWGARSFNIGAGMARLNTAAAFIQANMPLGHGNTLSEQQAYDVAAYVLSHPRPDFADKAYDWPKGGKPSDAPY